jgi:hypothetical protein
MQLLSQVSSVHTSADPHTHFSKIHHNTAFSSASMSLQWYILFWIFYKYLADILPFFLSDTILHQNNRMMVGGYKHSLCHPIFNTLSQCSSLNAKYESFIAIQKYMQNYKTNKLYRLSDRHLSMKFRANFCG